uniref:HDC15101 n=1 Tax=Drosophila melanogaster TaxID=7227 RepID=Q6IJD6_DROME|nr:TPA_inf: HDC15101 [Drosophila melanogaster]
MCGSLAALAAHVKPVRKMNRLTIDKRESLTSSRPPLLHHPLGGKLNLGGKAEVSREKQGGQADSICIFRVSNGRTSLHLADGSRKIAGKLLCRRSTFTTPLPLTCTFLWQEDFDKCTYDSEVSQGLVEDCVGGPASPNGQQGGRKMAGNKNELAAASCALKTTLCRGLRVDTVNNLHALNMQQVPSGHRTPKLNLKLHLNLYLYLQLHLYLYLNPNGNKGPLTKVCQCATFTKAGANATVTAAREAQPPLPG